MPTWDEIMGRKKAEKPLTFQERLEENERIRKETEFGKLEELHDGKSVYYFGTKEPKQIEHDLLVTDLHIRVKPKLWEQTGLQQHGINPDAFFYTHSYFFLEVENKNAKTEDGMDVKMKKAAQYERYADQRHHKSRCDNFRVLFDFETQTKAANFINKIAKSQLQNKGRFWASWRGTEAISVKGTHSVTT